MCNRDNSRTGLLGAGDTATQASYDLTRLRRNAIITRLPGTNTYHLTAHGLRFAIFYTKVHNRLRPVRRRPTQASPTIRDALATIDRHLTEQLAHARLHAAA